MWPMGQKLTWRYYYDKVHQVAAAVGRQTTGDQNVAPGAKSAIYDLFVNIWQI